MVPARHRIRTLQAAHLVRSTASSPSSDGHYQYTERCTSCLCYSSSARRSYAHQKLWRCVRAGARYGAPLFLVSSTPYTKVRQRFENNAATMDADAGGWASRVLLRSAELSSCARGTEAYTRVVAGCACIQGIILARRVPCGYVSAHRSEASAWGTCNVCTPEGP